MAKSNKNTASQAIWEILKGVSESQDEITEIQKKNAKGMVELRESTTKLRESTAELRESQKETDRQMKETDKRLDKRLNKLSESIDKANGNFNNKWGEFMEKLVKGDLINLLQDRGIEVTAIHHRIEIRGKNKNREAEFDLAAVNGEVAVIFEVKTSLEISDVHDFLKKLKTFKDRLGHTGKKIYGGIAYLDTDKNAGKFAIKKGLFVIESPGGDAQVSKIINDKDFKPTAF